MPAITLLLAAALGCRHDDPAAVEIRFEPDAPALGAVPFPSDLFRDTAGAWSLGPWPNPRDDEPLFDAIRALLATRDGFCATCAVRFGATGAPALPRHLDGALGDPVLGIDLDTGHRVPLDLTWDSEAGWITARPAPGASWAPGHRHAVVVTDAATDIDGRPLGAAEAFRDVVAGAAGADPRATEVLTPDLAALRGLGIAPERIVGLAAFTAEDPTLDLRRVSTLLADRAPATVVVDEVYAGPDALDDLLGVPAEDRPGIDVPGSAPGERAVRHATTAVVVRGRFPAARFVTGHGTELGTLDRDADGGIVSTSDDDVPFVLIVPAGADVHHLPVVVSHHGFSASRTTAFVLADTAGARGWAVLGIDAFQHGDRAPSAVDTVHAMRGGTPGPDGFGEASALDVMGRMFGLFGTPPGQAVDPAFPLAAFTQFAADGLSTWHLLAEGDWSAVAAADPALDGLAFDPDRRVFVGNSMGAVVGTRIAAADPTYDAVVLDVMPGAIVDTLCSSGAFRPMAESLLLPALGVDTWFDEVERPMALDPTVDLVRWVLEPVDPLALAPFLVRNGGPQLRVQLAGHDEIAAPAPSEAVLALAGIPGIGAFDHAAVAPWTEGEAVPNALAVRWEGAMHQMLELATETSVWDDPLVPPLTPLPDPELVENPIVAVHDDIAAVLAGFDRAP